MNNSYGLFSKTAFFALLLTTFRIHSSELPSLEWEPPLASKAKIEYLSSLVNYVSPVIVYCYGPYASHEEALECHRGRFKETKAELDELMADCLAYEQTLEGKITGSLANHRKLVNIRNYTCEISETPPSQITNALLGDYYDTKFDNISFTEEGCEIPNVTPTESPGNKVASCGYGATVYAHYDYDFYISRSYGKYSWGEFVEGASATEHRGSVSLKFDSYLKLQIRDSNIGRIGFYPNYFKNACDIGSDTPYLIFSHDEWLNPWRIWGIRLGVLW